MYMFQQEKEKETDELENFFGQIHEFHTPTPAPAVFVPAALPPRYAINFVPALHVTPPVSASAARLSPVSPVSASVPAVLSSPYSVVSSAYLVIPSCIETKP